MARRSFSFMLAWRYLNPRRAMLSAVTLISVTGVLLGVLVLVVVMAVYAGMERDVKRRMLGYTPHVRIEYFPGGFREPIAEWREAASEVSKLEGVQSATAFMQDYVLLDVDSRQRPAFFRGIDTQDVAQVAGVAELLDTDDFPGSTADLGQDDRVVISSVIARQLGIGVGETMSLYSARNFGTVKRAYEITARPPAREEFAPLLAQVKEAMAAPWPARGDKAFVSTASMEAIYYPLFDGIYQEDIRADEKEIVARFLLLFDEGEQIDDGFLVAAGDREKALGILAELDTTDVEKMDAAALKEIKELVLPKEAQVVGVYKASQMMLTPDIFMPLHLAQELAGLQGEVQGIAVRLDDPYQAEQVLPQVMAGLSDDWQATTWIEEFGDFSRLINQQRVMMYFALSFIILVSAFSMMAVMFTVTIQKRREIGVMKALGAAPGQIVRVFVHQGMILGFLGALLGAGFGLLVIRFRGQLQEVLRLLGFDPFPKSFHGFEILPAHVNPVEITIIAIAAFILCAVAAFVPAFFAARSDAAKSLRNL